MKRIIAGLLASLAGFIFLTPPFLHAQVPVSTPSNATANCYLYSADATRYDGGLFINTTNTIYYLKLYDMNTTPTPSTAIPVRRIPVVATPSGPVLDSPLAGLHFYRGFAYCLTGGVSDTDATAAAAGVMLNFNLTPQ